LVAYCPLGRGFLSGEGNKADECPADDYRRGENFDRNLRLVDLIRGIARRKGATPAQISLAWLLHQGYDIVPIPGTRRRAHLEQNLEATRVQLGAEERAELARAAAPGTTAGPRYGEHSMSLIDRS
jgi:aryl-alcohol dehydrogenase-like predicted oxidoreductase